MENKEYPIKLHPITDEFHNEYPFSPNFININGKHMHYVDEGQGEPFLMVHGNPSWSFLYRNSIKYFSENFRCIVPDHIGCGRSEKPEDFEYTLENHINNLEKLILELNLTNITMMVHDWGGAIGMGVAGRHSERFKNLIISNTAAFFFDSIPFRINICKIPLFGDIAIKGFNSFAEAAIHMAISHKDRITDEIKKGFLAPYDNWNNRRATHEFVKDIPMHQDHRTTKPLKKVEKNLSNLKNIPMLILWGMKDFCFHESFLLEWEKRFPEAKIMRYNDANHYLLEDAHERINPVIESFLNKKNLV